MGRPGKLFDQDAPDGGDDDRSERPRPRRGAFFDQDDDGYPFGRSRDPLPAWPEPASPDPTGQPILRITSSPSVRSSPWAPARRPEPLDGPVAESPVRPRPPARPPAQPQPQPGPQPPAQPRRRPPAPSRPSAAPRSDAAPPAGPGRAAEGSRSMASSTALMAGGTLLSRLTGFARVLLVATVLGTSGLGDAYNLANSVPNIVYDLLLGGILSATLVPVFVDELGRGDRRDGERAISAVVTAIGVALVAISALLYLLAPWVLRFYLLLNHTSSKAAEQAVGADLLHLFAPQVFLLGAIVVSTALLNARRRFGAAAFSPVVNNLLAIAALVATRVTASNLQVGPFRHEHGPLVILGVGTTLGYLVQLLVQWPAQRRAGIHIRPVWDPGHPAVRRVAGLSAWLVGTVVANQIAFNVILVFAARNDDVTIYNTAYQFFQLPYALFTVSIASTLTPDLAERWTRGDVLGFQRRIIRGLRVTLGILIPAAAGYAVIAEPLIDLGVLYGHVSVGGAHLIGASLALFAVGLPGFSAFALLMRAYQAMQDARAMFSMYVVENLLTLVATVALYPSLGVKGLAVAFIAPYTVVAVVAATRLRRRIGSLGGSFTVRALGRIVLATAAMLVVLLALDAVLPGGRSHLVLVVRVVVELGAGTVAYVAAARVLGIEEVEPVLGLARRRVR